MLLIIPKDPVFAEVLVFSNIFGFPTVNCAPIWTQTVNVNCIPFEPKFDTYWRLFLVKVSARSNNIWGIKGPKNTKKGRFHGCWINTKKKLKILISQPHMLYWWILPHIYLNKVFQLAKFWGAYHRVYEGVNEKSLKMNKKINFLAQIWPYLNTSKNCSIFDTSSCLSPPVKNVGCFWRVLTKNPPKSNLKWQFLLVRKHLKI